MGAITIEIKTLLLARRLTSTPLGTVMGAGHRPYTVHTAGNSRGECARGTVRQAGGMGRGVGDDLGACSPQWQSRVDRC